MATGDRSVLVAGASGLVGRQVLAHLARDQRFSRYVVLTRRPLTLHSDPRLELHVVDFRTVDRFAAGFPVDAVICALGTTIRKAGSKEAFRQVDLEYPLRLAELAAANRSDRFLLVSSLGANPRSRVFYSRIKGEVEAAIAETGVHGFTILRPSLLLGPRTEFRPGEAVAKLFLPLMPRKYRGISADAVARVLVERAALPGSSGPPEILESDRIRKLALG